MQQSVLFFNDNFGGVIILIGCILIMVIWVAGMPLMLCDLLMRRGAFTLFVAPPAWGKTRLLVQLHQAEDLKILFISPLRALAEDFFQSLRQEKKVLMIKKYKDRFSLLNQFNLWSQGLMVTTAEMIDEFFLNRLNQHKVVAVFDEFHLFYYWGQSFREHLFELLMAVSNQEIPILGLSATIGSQMFEQWQRDFILGASELFYLDLGNQKLKYPPSQITTFYNRKSLERRFLWHLCRSCRRNVIIYFCAYRSQVDYWVKRCCQEGLVALGCKGGEVASFSKKLQQSNQVDVIFATTSLSHGVNLPMVEEIYIDHVVANRDFWIQMVGRGGRRGEVYRLFCLDAYVCSRFKRLKDLIFSLVFDVLIRGGLYFRSCKPRLKA